MSQRALGSGLGGVNFRAWGYIGYGRVEQPAAPCQHPAGQNAQGLGVSVQGFRFRV